VPIPEAIDVSTQQPLQPHLGPTVQPSPLHLEHLMAPDAMAEQLQGTGSGRGRSKL
jgi:hypothetical protein